MSRMPVPRGKAGFALGGFTLLEVMIAAAIFSIGIMGFMNSFSFIARAVQVTRSRTVAANLCQAQVESLKNNSYYALQVTTVNAVNNNFSPALTYSSGTYGLSTVNVAGIKFYTAARIDYAAIVSSQVTAMSWSDPDPGMKLVTVYVMWKEQGRWKYLSLQNLLENPNVAPQTATLTGTIRESGTTNTVAGVTVKTIENPSLQGTSNASGVYSFKVNAGTYTLTASTSTFFLEVSSSINVSAGATVTKDFTMVRVATGNVAGYAWLRPTQFLISGVVTSTNTYIPELGTNQDVDLVELVNPTTTNFSFNAIYYETFRHNNWNDSPYKMSYGYGYYPYMDTTWDYMSFRSTYIPAQGYFLIANTSYSFVLNNTVRQADTWIEGYQYYDGTNWTIYSAPQSFPNMIRSAGETTGGVSVYVAFYDMNWAYIYDYVGWRGSNNKEPMYYKTDYLRCNNGIEQGEQVVRFSTPAWKSSTYLRTYDLENTRLDFDCNRYGSSQPMTHTVHSFGTAAQTPLSGVPAYGAIVSANDLYGGATVAYSVTITTNSGGLSYKAAYFKLQGVSTGTWTVDLASSGYYTTISSVTISTSNQTVMVPSTITIPSTVAGGPNTLLATKATYGYVSGYVYDIAGVAIPGINVNIGSTPTSTNTQGYYYAAESTGPCTVVFNVGNANSSYVSEVANITLEEGVVTSLNMNLARGGTLKGYVTSGVTALPNIPFNAYRNNTVMASGTSDSSGYFYIYNLSTGSYTVSPALDPVSDASPDDSTVNLATAGTTVFTTSWTVTGAYGAITGTIKKGAASITTGALVIASSVTLTSTPPTISGVNAVAGNVYYAVSSLSDGTYTVLVRGATNYTYNLRAYYPTLSGQTVTNNTVSYTGLSVSAGGSTTQNIVIP